MRMVQYGCPEKYVSDGMRDKLDDWGYFTTVFIDAPTGAGKNTFVLDVLAEKAKEENKCVLLFSNRTALSYQQKLKLFKRNCAEEIAKEDLMRMHQFDNVFVFSYQTMSMYMKNGSQFPVDTRCLKYVVFDEAHFFLSDARFNETTYSLFWWIRKQMRNITRIYMTATPQEILKPLLEQEEYANALDDGHIPQPGSPYVSARQAGGILRVYSFPRCYSNEIYNFQFFDAWEELTWKIQQTDSNEKWLIFVRSEADKKELESLLEKEKKSIAFLNAKRKSDEVYQEICNREKFSKRILISTTVLDNGINIHDPALKHIAIFSFDRVSMIQMVGRKRLDEGERLNLYIRCPSDTSIIDQEITTNQRLIKCIEKAHKNTLFRDAWGELEKDEQHILYPTFSYSNGVPVVSFSVNHFAEVKIHKDLARMERLKDISCRKNERIQEEILSWFPGAPEYNKSMQLTDITSVVKSVVVAHVEENIAKKAEIVKSSVLEEMKWLKAEFEKIPGAKYNIPKNDVQNRFVSETKKLFIRLELDNQYAIERINGTRDDEKWQYGRKS